MKKIESLHFLTSLIEIHEIKEYWQECAGQYYVIDIVTLFNSTFGDIVRLIREGKLYYK